MKTIKGLSIVILVMLVMSVVLKAQYLDVGDDPTKLKIIKTTEVNLPAGYEFKQWSPDGEYFAISNEAFNSTDVKKTYLINKFGQTYKQFDGYFKLWSADSKNIVVVDSTLNVWIITIASSVKLKANISIKHDDDICQYKKDNKILFKNYDEIYEYDVAFNSSSLKFKPEIKKEVDDVFESDNCLIFTQYFNVKDEPLYIYRLVENRKVKLLSGFNTLLKYYFTKNSQLIINKMTGSIINFYEIGGNVIFNISANYFKVRDFSFDFPNSSLAPNGRLFASTYRDFYEDESLVKSADIYLVSLVSGKVFNWTNTTDKIEIVKGWSPQGNRIVYLEYTTKKLIIAEVGK